jgi:hypothetical protein
MLSQGRLFIFFLKKNLLLYGLTDVCLPSVVLKPLVRGRKKRKEE